MNNGRHAHSVVVTDPGHEHGVTVEAIPLGTMRADFDGKHIHTKDSVKGRIGLVTNGVDGNGVTMVTGDANPPFIALNYIITI